MTQPTPYSRQYSATAWSTNSPSLPHPGVSMDAEWNAVKVTLDGVLRSLLVIQRDDGALRNAIVTLDSCSPSVLVTLGASATWKVRGAWLTSTAYAASDVIVSGALTYVCAIAHTSGVLAADVTAGRWVLLFDDAADAIPAGGVGTTELANGAVTAAKLGFTSLDLAGSLRGQGGVASGTAAAGSLMRAKKDTGDVLVEVERATAGQGEAGFKVIGANLNWTMGMASGGALLEFKSSTVGSIASFSADGLLDLQTLRAKTSALPATGSGTEILFGGGIGFVQAFDRSGAAWLPLKLRGSSVFLTAGGVDVAEATPTGLTVQSGLEVGFRRVPRSTTTTTAVVGDAARCIAVSAGITIPASIFAAGDALSIYNDSGSAITITQGAGLTLRLAGTATTGNRTLAARGLATIWFNSATEAASSGAGVS